MGDRQRRRIGQTDVEAQDFWQKIEEVCTLVISNKRFNPEVMKRKYPDNYPEDMMGGEFGQMMFGIALFLGLVVAFIIYLLFKVFTIL